MANERAITIYELSLNVRTTWQAHSLSNAGSNGSNRTLPRRQLLADGTEVDAISGNILKRKHAELLAEYLKAQGVPLCPACVQGNGQRAATLLDHPDYQAMNLSFILQRCGVCDVHGFLVTAKKSSGEEGSETRQRLSKHSLIEYSFGLALPEEQTENSQLFTRMGAMDGNGQMLIKKAVRSASYALCVRYKCVGIGTDTETWEVVVPDETERLKRHRATLEALRDAILSPDGAMTSTLLPHLTGVEGVVVVRTNAGRAPVYSPLESGFIDLLSRMASDSVKVMPFRAVDQFHQVMEQLIAASVPFVGTTVQHPVIAKG